MDKQKDSLSSKIKRELMRAALERTQTMDTSKIMSFFIAKEPAVYEDVKETLNVAYVNRDEVALAMDIFKPKNVGNKELPVIIMIHGGGLYMGDRGQNRPYCRLLAHKGYLVFSIEYRLAPKANIREQLDDVCAGMDEVGRMLVDYNVDFTRIFLVADSAGAYLATYVSAMHESETLQELIGYEPSRMVYAAIGTICGMFYTSRELQDQIFGDRRYDDEFVSYMDPEHPEILNNLPPVFMMTSCGDTLNNYSLRFHKALKDAGRPVKLVYFGDEALYHVFAITNPEHPKSLEGTDKMLAYFEEQAAFRRESHKKDSETMAISRRVKRRIKDGSISNQKAWSGIKERISFDANKMKKPAIIDCTRKYTYEQMFDEWERYARAFSALNICMDNASRVALCGSITAETIFSLYGLNMTGAEVSLFSYPDFLPNGMWKDMIEKEKITDLIVSDIMVTDEVWTEICEVKEQFGLRNAILMHSLMGGITVGPAELTYNEFNYHMLKRRSDTVFLGDLLEAHKNAEIKYDNSKGERMAVIVHTSGTAHGTRKMLPFTDKLLNDTLRMFPDGYREFMEKPVKDKQLRVLLSFDLSSIAVLSGQVHGPLATGDCLVTTFFGFMHPKFVRAIEYYKVNMIQITGFMIDKWMRRSDLEDVDFSSLKVVGLSGGFIPPKKMEAYREFFRSHGCSCDLTAGYGMSEAGGKPMFAPKGGHSDILGYADEPETYRVKDENDGKFYRIEDGPRTGILYKQSETRPSNMLDGEVLFEYTQIDGMDYICTNDLVRVNEDGSISFAGRADHYFVNNEGREFNAGIVDTNMALQPAIDRCAVVPVMEKRIHDTVPVLWVVPARKGSGAAEAVRKAFVDVYVKEKKIGFDNIPTQFMLVDDIPLNPNGKLDIFRITRERLQGDAYDLIPVMKNGELTDIEMKHKENVNSMTGGTLPEGMENNSAYNIFEFFNMDSDDNGSDSFKPFRKINPLKPWEMFLPDMDELKKNTNVPAIPKPVIDAAIKYGNRLFGLSTGRKHITYDFED